MKRETARLYIASSNGTDWCVARDLVRVLTGDLVGSTYIVKLRALPGHTFRVEARNVDDAHARVVKVVRANGKALLDTTATIQRDGS